MLQWLGSRLKGESPTIGPAAGPDLEKRVGTLEERMKHLEAQLEGLQDSVHREAVRRDRASHERRGR
jgi:hypothetical protein